MEIQEYAKMDRLETDHWWFVAKRDYLALTLKKYFGNLSGKKILDVGCGTGAVLKFVGSLGAEAVGVDMSDEALKFCESKGLRVSKGTADKIDFPDQTFDAVVVSDVLEHLENEGGAVKEIYRVLKPGGICIATVPAHQFLFSSHDVALHHYRRYSRSALQKLLKTSFPTLELSWIHSFILLPAIFRRLFLKFLKGKESDMNYNPSPLNRLMGFIYKAELFFFKTFFYLPFGLSLLAVGKKESYEKE